MTEEKAKNDHRRRTTIQQFEFDLEAIAVMENTPERARNLSPDPVDRSGLLAKKQKTLIDEQ